MTNERKKLIAELVDGKLRVPGDKTEYLPAEVACRTLWLSANNLTLGYHTTLDDGKVTRSAIFSGIASMDRDRLRLAGWGDVCSELPFSIKAAPELSEDGLDMRWYATIGFIPADWECCSADEWFAEAWIPSEDLNQMLAAYRAGEIKQIHLGLKVNAWITDGEQYTPVGYGITWYLVPGQNNESSFPNSARGTMIGLSWSNKDHANNEDAEAKEATERAATPNSQASDRSKDMIAAINRLRSTVFRVGILISGALFLVALRSK